MTIEELNIKKKELGYSNEQISRLSGIPVSTVQRVLSGSTASPRRSTLLALESIFSKPGQNFSYHDRQKRTAAAGCVSESSAGYAVQPVPSVEPPVRYPDQGSYTLEDYLALPDDQRVELIDGVFYDMSAPSVPHQLIGGDIYFIIKNHILSKGGNCLPFAAPADVQLDCDDRTIVQPDVFVVCDRSKIKRARIFGAPDLVIEVLSPSTRFKDILVKTAKYMDAGVREYWQVDPVNESVTKFISLPPDAENPEGNIRISAFSFEDTVPVFIFDDECAIDFKKIKAAYAFMQES